MKIRTAVYIILILMAAVSIMQGAANALHFSQDFQYDAALALRQGINPYRESLEPDGALNEGALAEFYRIFEEGGAPQKMEANQFPSLLMLLFPLTFLPFRAARVTWLIFNLLFTIFIIILLRKTFLKDADSDVFNVAVLLLLAGLPWRNQIGVGQHTLFSFSFFLLAVYLMEKDMAFASGLALAVSYFKYTLTAPLAVYFLYRKKYREFAISLVPHIIGTGIGAYMLKTDYISMIREPLKVSSALAGEGSIDLGVILSGANISMLLTVLIMLGLIITAFILPQGEDKGFFSILIFLSLIMTYHRIYDFFVLTAALCGTGLAVNSPGTGGKQLSQPAHKLISAGYVIILLYFYFALRLFNENGISMVTAAVLYYAYVILYVCFFAKNILRWGKRTPA